MDEQLHTKRRLLALADDLYAACARAALAQGLRPEVMRRAQGTVEGLLGAHAAQTPKRPTRPGPRVTKKV